MARRIFHIGLLGLVLVAGAGAYALRRNLSPQEPAPAECTRHWLALSRTQQEQIHRDDPDFHQEAQTLAQVLGDQKQALIERVSDADTASAEIRDQALAVLDANHALVRRIVQHLLVVRRHADVRQCTLLNQLCADVMQPAGLQAGRGRGGRQRGRGGPWGQGQGQGRGRRQRHRYGQMASSLGLTQAQHAEAVRIDPNYESEAARLTQEVRDAHLRLAQALEDPNTSASAVQQTVEDFLAVRTQLELRTVDYVLTLRPMLTTRQQQQLIGLSQRGRGRRWRGGRP